VLFLRAAKLHASFGGGSMTLERPQLVFEVATKSQIHAVGVTFAGSSLCCSCVLRSFTPALVVAA
jgi:hypothetical protein